MVLVSKTKIIEDDTFLENFLGRLEKHVYFGVFTKIDQIHSRIPLKPSVRKIKGNSFWKVLTFFYEKKIKIFILSFHKTSYGHLKVWSKMDKLDSSGIATQN